MNTIKILATLFLMLGLSSCSYKKSLGDKVYIEYRTKSNERLIVAHTNPNCPNLDSYFVAKPANNGAFVICAKCVKEEDASKILGH